MTPSPYPSLTGEEVTAAARSGEAEPWEELVKRHYPPLLRYLTASLGDSESAADLAQDTFVVAYSKLATLRSDVAFVPWLYGVARHHLLPFWRRSRLLHFESLDTLLEHGETIIFMRRSDELASVEERDPIQRALSQLSPLLREALLLHTLNGLTAREIADHLRISEAAAEGRIGRGAAAFRLHYGRLGSPTEHGRRTGEDVAGGRRPPFRGGSDGVDPGSPGREPRGPAERAPRELS